MFISGFLFFIFLIYLLILFLLKFLIVPILFKNIKSKVTKNNCIPLCLGILDSFWVYSPLYMFCNLNHNFSCAVFLDLSIIVLLFPRNWLLNYACCFHCPLCCTCYANLVPHDVFIVNTCSHFLSFLFSPGSLSISVQI